MNTICDLSHWLKCEQVFVIAPSVNRTLMIEPNCEKKNCKLISNNKIYLELNNSPILGLKFLK
jgi:hypothetical protein